MEPLTSTPLVTARAARYPWSPHSLRVVQWIPELFHRSEERVEPLVPKSIPSVISGQKIPLATHQKLRGELHRNFPKAQRNSRQPHLYVPEGSTCGRCPLSVRNSQSSHKTFHRKLLILTDSVGLAAQEILRAPDIDKVDAAKMASQR